MFSLIGAITIALGYGALRQGAVTDFDASITTAAIGAIAAGYFLVVSGRDAPPNSGVVVALVVLAISLPLLNLVPLDRSTLRLLSPDRAQLAGAIGPFAPTPLSYVPGVSLRWLSRLAAALLLLLLAREVTWNHRSRPWLVLAPPLFIATGEALLGCSQFFGSGTRSAARGTYVNRDHFSGLLELAIPACVILAVAAYRHGRRRFESSAGGAILSCCLITFATLMILAVVFSLSRMGFLCTLGSLFIVGTVSSTSNLSGKLGLRLKFLPAAAVGVVVLVAFVWLPTNDLVQRFATVGSGELRADARIRIWHETIPLIRESPWLGSGLGSYESTFLRYKKVAPMATVSHAHNDYLEALCELGVLGIAPLLILGGLSFSSAVRAACGPADVPERYLGVACLGALSAAFLHSWVDFNLHIPANAFMLAWLAGISLGLWPSSKFSSTASRKVLTKTRGLVPAIR